MVRKLKAMAEKQSSESQLRAAVKDSAQEIWLAGLGAFAKAQEEGQKVFKALVREGTSIQKRTMKVTEDKVNDVTAKVTQVAAGLQKQANGTWDKLETVFDYVGETALIGFDHLAEDAIRERIETAKDHYEARRTAPTPRGAIPRGAPGPANATRLLQRRLVAPRQLLLLLQHDLREGLQLPGGALAGWVRGQRVGNDAPAHHQRLKAAI